MADNPTGEATVEGTTNQVTINEEAIADDAPELKSFYQYIPEFITEEEEEYLLRKVG